MMVGLLSIVLAIKLLFEINNLAVYKLNIIKRVTVFQIVLATYFCGHNCC